MTFKRVLILLILAGTTPAVAVRKPAPPVTQPALSQKQVDDLKNDLERMKALVNQMQSNLAFVDTTQSPLKHQFQLEIDMWNLMIRQMEARLQPGSTPRP